MQALRRTADRLFLAFALAFGLLALNRFILILLAIVDKNLSGRRKRQPDKCS